jgi:hypothetical protein
MKADQPLRTRLQHRIQCPAGRERLLPLVGMSECVKLQKVDVVGVEPLERAPDLCLGAFEAPLVGFGRQEEGVTVPVHPRSDPEFGVAISGRRIDVVHTVLEQQVEHPVGGILVDRLERRTAEDDR